MQDGLYEWGGDVGAPYIDQLRGLEEISDCLMTVEGGQAVEMDAWMYGVQTLARIYNALTVLLEHLDTGVIRQDHEELKQGLQNLFDDKLQAALEEENVWRAFNSGEQLYIDAAFAFLEEDRVNEAAGATPILLDPLNEQALLGGKPVPKLLQKKRLYPYPMGSCTVEARQFGFLF